MKVAAIQMPTVKDKIQNILLRKKGLLHKVC